jgi:NhaA family Na+:H+ antiporter
LLSPAQRLARDLQPWSAFFVLPLLALANAGIPLADGANSLLEPVSLGIVVGLVVGKPVGIALAAMAVVRAGWADLPAGITWRHVIGAGFLCGIGFTMSIFIAYAAFQDPHTLVAAKLSIMLASALAATVGWLLLRKGTSAVEGTRKTPLVVPAGEVAGP